MFKWNSELLEANTLKLSKKTGWSQINIWSLTAVDFLDLDCLFVKGEIPECLRNETHCQIHKNMDLST